MVEGTSTEGRSYPTAAQQLVDSNMQDADDYRRHVAVRLKQASLAKKLDNKSSDEEGDSGLDEEEGDGHHPSSGLEARSQLPHP